MHRRWGTNNATVGLYDCHYCRDSPNPLLDLLPAPQTRAADFRTKLDYDTSYLPLTPRFVSMGTGNLELQAPGI